MPTYGFEINCDTNAVLKLREIRTELGETGSTAKLQAAEIENSFAGMGEKLSGIFGNLKSIIAGGILAGGVFGGYEFIRNSKEAYDELQKSITRVDTVLRSTHGAAGLSGSRVKDQAEELSKHIVDSKASILDAQGMLLSFTGIKGPVFGETTKAVADFATFYKEDMTSAALQIGKALNNPAQGMNRLQRQGVAFTDEQKKQIKNYQEQGQLVKAQEVILKELNREFGGQAVAFSGTDAGKIAMAGKEWEDLKVEIGGVISQVQLQLLPLFSEVKDYTKEAFDSGIMQFFIAHLKDLLTIGLRLIPMWAIYKGLQEGNELLSSKWTLTTKGLKIAMQEETVATGEAAAATEELSLAWSTFGWGALAVGLGYIVEKFISWNQEINNAVEGITNLKNIQGNANPIFQTGNEVWSSYLHDKSFSASQKGDLYNKAISDRDAAKNMLTVDITPRIAETIKQLANLKSDQKAITNDPEQVARFGHDEHLIQKLTNDLSGLKILPDQLKGIIAQSTNLISDYSKQNEAIIEYNKHHKIKKDLIIPPKGYSPAGGGTTGLAYSTSELAGAKGGLGEAKVINIHIDTVQKNVGVTGDGVANNADKAIQFMIRAINNMAQSQSSTF